MNGLEAVKQIRLMETQGTLTGRLPVIGVTANVRQQQIQTAVEAGMDDVVGKPFKVSELLVRMKVIVEDAAVSHDAVGLGIASGTV
jgi:CheY-like chemotaxis protein